MQGDLAQVRPAIWLRVQNQMRTPATRLVVVGILAVGALEIGGPAGLRLVGNADIGREPARDLVAQPEAQFSVGQAGADAGSPARPAPRG